MPRWRRRRRRRWRRWRRRRRRRRRGGAGPSLLGGYRQRLLRPVTPPRGAAAARARTARRAQGRWRRRCRVGRRRKCRHRHRRRRRRGGAVLVCLRAAPLAVRVRGLRDGLRVHQSFRLARRAPHACTLPDPCPRTPGVPPTRTLFGERARGARSRNSSGASLKSAGAPARCLAVNLRD